MQILMAGHKEIGVLCKLGSQWQGGEMVSDFEQLIV